METQWFAAPVGREKKSLGEFKSTRKEQKKTRPNPKVNSCSRGN